MNDTNNTNKRGYYKANVQKQKDKLSLLGHYTVHSVNMQKVLSLREYAVLEIIRHEIEVGSEYISYSLLEVETGFTRVQCIEAVKNLSTLDFISAYLKTKKGTIYKVHISEISSIVGKLNGCNNRVERLRIADQFRVKKGLRAQNETAIKQFTGSGFDTDSQKSIHNSERYKVENETNNESQKDKPKKEILF